MSINSWLSNTHGDITVIRPLVAAVTTALVAMHLSGCHDSHAQSGEAEPLVRVVHPVVATASASGYTGTIHARIESDLGFRVSGKIVTRLVDPGQLVRRGQALLRLDPTNLSLAASAAHQKLLAAQAEATRAGAEVQRQKDLLAEGAISSSSYEAALAAATMSAANQKAAEAEAQDADLQLRYGTLTAGADGTVLEVLAQPGQVVAAGAPVLRLAEAGAREALIAIPETAIASVPKDAMALVYGRARPLTARLREIAGSADAVTRSFAARYTLDAPLNDVPLGATVTLSMRASVTSDVQIPLAALHDGGKGMGVWVVSGDGQTRFRAVTVNALGAETADIAPGALEPNDFVVALGAHLLREGERVRIMKDPS